MSTKKMIEDVGLHRGAAADLKCQMEHCSNVCNAHKIKLLYGIGCPTEQPY